MIHLISSKETQNRKIATSVFSMGISVLYVVSLQGKNMDFHQESSAVKAEKQKEAEFEPNYKDQT